MSQGDTLSSAGVGGNAEPAFFRFQTGSPWLSDFSYPKWAPWFASLHWEQQIGINKFVFRPSLPKMIFDEVILHVRRDSRVAPGYL